MKGKPKYSIGISDAGTSTFGKHSNVLQLVRVFACSRAFNDAVLNASECIILFMIVQMQSSMSDVCLIQLFFFTLNGKMHNCILLHTNREIIIEKIDHKKIGDILGRLTFVGAIDDFSAIAVGKYESNANNDIINPFCSNTKYFEKNIYGTVILIGSDKDGEAMDLDTNSIINKFFNPPLILI